MYSKVQYCLNHLKSIRSLFKLVVVLMIIWTIGVVLSSQQEWTAEDWRYCFMDPDLHRGEPLNVNPNGLEPLEDIILSDLKPKAGKSIFFHETTCSPKGISSSKVNLTLNSIRLSARQSCAIESAALHNPNFNIFVLFAAPTYWKKNDLSTSPFIQAISSYPNVQLRNLNLWTYAAGTPIYTWLHMGKLFHSNYVLSHISDFLRYLTLWRYGGTYLDMDIVMIRSIEDLTPNYAGAESLNYVASGVMNFGADGFGHELATKCLEDIEKNFDGGDWGNNGPGVITRIIKEVCKSYNITEIIKHCGAFKVFERSAFYSIPWFEWQKFFDEENVEEVMQRFNQSYLIHVWNKHSSHRKVKTGTKTAYGLIAAKNCPKVYASAGSYF